MFRWLIDLMFICFITPICLMVACVRQSQNAVATTRVSISVLGPMFFTIDIHSRWLKWNSSIAWGYRGA
ncbi:hypothetical protein Hanom_Chr16g01522041 [Helianthus anomalus]